MPFARHFPYANLDSREDRGGSEEPTQAYLGYVEESDAAIAQHPVRTTKVCT
jgi:hypothetical protein